jgi:tetratricopeptide (TPR) repeat protein
VWTKALIVIIFNSSFVILESQVQGQAYVDSLVNEIPKLKKDTNAINAYIGLSFINSYIDPLIGLDYGYKGLELNKKVKWEKGEASLYNSIGKNYHVLSNKDSAIFYLNKSIEINKKFDFQINLADNYNNYGLIYSMSDRKKSYDYHKKALVICEKYNYKIGKAAALHNIGTYHFFNRELPKAMECLFNALKINEEINYNLFKSINYEGLGQVYYELQNSDKAIEYLTKSLKLTEELGLKYRLPDKYFNLSLIYYSDNDFSKAIEYLEIAEDLLDKVRKEDSKANFYQNFGVMYYNLHNYDKAVSFTLKAIELCKKNNDSVSLAYSIGNLGGIYSFFSRDSIIKINPEKSKLMNLQKINQKRSIQFLENSREIFKKLGIVNQNFEYDLDLFNAYKSLGNFQKALMYYENYIKMRDSITNSETKITIANLEAKRDNELKDKEITILHSEKKAQQFQSYLLGGGVLVFIGAFGVAFLRFREKKKLSEALEIQKNIVEVKNEEIVSSITYASTIQHAILPWDSTLQKAFSEILIFYKPKDIVSGDSYWFQEVDGIKFLAVIDCTGHGIPGAMLTVIASSVLDDAVLSKKFTDTGKILTYMNEKVTEVLNQKLAENRIRDGMEVAMIAVHQDRIQFSGAGRPLFVKNKNLETYKTDKRGIAGQTDSDVYQFTAIEIDKSDNIIFYLTTDGFADQMNENSKKFSTKRFIALLDLISEQPLSEQEKILENEFNNHKGRRSQIDDLTILGVRI